MFKVITAEIKKSLSKPGIYVLAVILALTLVLGVFIYKPESIESTNSKINETTYTGKYSLFYEENVGIKDVIDSKIQDITFAVSSYQEIVDSKLVSKQSYINTLFNIVKSNFYEYRNCAADNSYEAIIEKSRNNLIDSINELDSAIVTAISATTKNSYALLVTNKTYDDYCKTIKEAKRWADMYATKSDLSEHCKTFNELLLPRLNECVNNFIYPTLSQKTIDDYTTESKTSKLTIVNERLQAIEQEIEKTYAIAIQSEEKNIELANKMDYYATQYKYTAETYTNMVEYNLLYNAFKTTSINDELDLKHLSNQSQYNTASLKIKYDYLFTNNKFDSDFAKPLTIGVASNNELNAYDYSYFVLKLFSFIVITYAILSACNTIAGENKDGTLRYFAIKPVSRYEIFFGKLFAIMLMSVILILFSTIISLLVGGTVYGFNTNTILTIFNGTTAITIHPISMLSIYLISLLIEITIYVSITMLLSTIIKSDLFAITIILVVYLINILLPLFVQGANNWLAFYPFSHISFYPLFGSAVYLQTNNFFSLLLGSKVYTTTNLGLIICVIILLISILNIVACKLFKNKEI